MDDSTLEGKQDFLDEHKDDAREEIVNEYLEENGLRVKIKVLEYDSRNGKITAYFIQDEINPFKSVEQINRIKAENEKEVKKFMNLRLGEAIILQK